MCAISRAPTAAAATAAIRVLDRWMRCIRKHSPLQDEPIVLLKLPKSGKKLLIEQAVLGVLVARSGIFKLKCRNLMVIADWLVTSRFRAPANQLLLRHLGLCPHGHPSLFGNNHFGTRACRGALWHVSGRTCLQESKESASEKNASDLQFS